MQYPFNASSSHSVGVEVELQLVDRQNLALSNSIDQILERVPAHWQESFKPEFMQSYCEINTDVCQNVDDVKKDLTPKLQWAQETAEELGVHFVWASTHPFSPWHEQNVSAGERYAWLLDTMQDVARRLVVFGLHVHVGVDSGDKAIQMCDRLLRHLPTLLALSANSPLWNGRDTGMRSYRSKIMEALPTAGMPMTLRNWSEYIWLIKHLIDTDFIRSIREIWWDVRPHARFGTVEIRVMDMPMCMDHLLGLVALTQSLVCAISEDIDSGAYQYDCHPMIARQNKWHAVRYGMDAMFVDSDTMLAIPAKQMAKRLVQQCTPYAERLGCANHLQNLHDIIENGTGAQRQLDVFRKTNDPAKVVQMLVDASAVGAGVS